MVDFRYLGMRGPEDFYLGANPEGPIELGNTKLFLPDEEEPEPSAYVMRWDIDSLTGPIPNVGDGPATTLSFTSWGTPNPSWDNGLVYLPQGTMMESTAFSLGFPETGSYATTHTPGRIKLGMKGRFSSDSILIEYTVWDNCGFSLKIPWDTNGLRSDIYRKGPPDYSVEHKSANDARRVLGTLQLYEAEWVNDPSGPGGTLTWYIDGIPISPSVTTTGKVKCADNNKFWISGSFGNPSNGRNMWLEYVELTYEY